MSITTAGVAAQPTLRTARLELRPFRLTDGPDVERLAGARAIADTTGTIPHPYPAGAGAPWISTHGDEWRAGRSARFAIVSRETGELLGAVGLERRIDGYVAELGYWIAEHAWRNGYASEASGAICAWGFATLGLQRIQAHYLTRNPASGRVMEKLGMRFECVQRKAARKWDVAEDIACYAVLAEEWFASPAAPMPEVMAPTEPLPAWPRVLSAGAVLFAGNTARLAQFYEAVAGLAVVHEDDGLVVLEGHGLQLVIHAMPGLAGQGDPATPPTPFEDSAIKLVFPVRSLARAADAVAAHGGRMMEGRTFEARGFRATDVCDCEGNIVQLRELLVPTASTSRVGGDT
ncbi:MAG: GNAT family N-acetyltransferase [Gemmatimonadetes bacterium]|nr:GNAT family N-acetyltransferase [Gemmatimonadota bacterium]